MCVCVCVCVRACVCVWCVCVCLYCSTVEASSVYNDALDMSECTDKRSCVADILQVLSSQFLNLSYFTSKNGVPA